MKKTISLVLVSAFILTLALQLPVLAEDSTSTETTATPILISAPISTTSTSTEARKPEPRHETSTLEKIPSPKHINLYNQIKKIGGDLFGVRKASSTIANITKNDDKKASSTLSVIQKKIEEIKKAGLEKITSIEQVKLFDKVTKVGNDLFGLKKKGVTILPTMTADLLACTSAAIDAKDTSISVSFTNSATEITTAIEARGTCQKAALALSTGREDALKACNKTFQEATKTANEKARKAQQETWTTYKTSLKACASTASTTELNIEDGGDILK